MWIFGQVWFACLVGFGVGVLLDWVIRVRPLTNRVAELERRLAEDARSARSDGELGRSVFDRGPFAPANMDSDGFVTQRNRGGLLTPSPERGGRDLGGGRDTSGRDLGTDLIAMGAAESAAPTEVRSGVEDYPGVSRLSAWETEAEEATRNAPEPWSPHQQQQLRQQPEPAVTDPDTPPEWQPIVSGTEPQQDDWRSQLSPPIEPPPPTDADADRQYLDFLRAGAAHAPTDPALGDEDGEFGSANLHGDVAEGDESPEEVTSVLPFPLSEQGETGEQDPRIEGYEAYESYADEYQRNGYERNGYSEPGYSEPGYAEPAYSESGYAEPSHSESGYSDSGYQYGGYQAEDVEEPEESSTPLPRRGSRATASAFTPFAPFAPFEIPFEPDAELADSQPRPGELTPIEDGGFQPFAKPPTIGEGDGYDTGEAPWLPGGEGAPASLNGAHALLEHDEDPGGSSWFDMNGDEQPGLPAAETTMTQRMLPVSRPDLDHPDLLGESVFGGANDPVYEEDEGARSLFEPIIPSEMLDDGYPSTNGHNGSGNGDGGSSGTGLGDSMEHQRESSVVTTEEIPVARPIRVRTGVDGPATQSIPAIQPVPQPGAGAPDGDPAAGPFGPGSALPLPDGSAPASEFKIKARTSSMVFHTESSPFYERLEPQVWFRSQEDAQRAGFTSWERPRTW